MEARDPVQGVAGLRGQRSGKPETLTRHHLPRPPASPPPLPPLLAPNSFPPPHPRHPSAGKGSFPASAAGSRTLSGVTFCRSGTSGRGEGRQPEGMKDEAPARRVGGGGGCHSRSPAHSAAITVPRPPPRPAAATRPGDRGCAAKPGNPRAPRSPATARRHREARAGQGRRGGV